MRYSFLSLPAAGLALAAASIASPGLAAHCGILTGAQFCDPVNVPAAGPFDEGTMPNDTVSPVLQVNTDAILGRTNWQFGGQYFFDDDMGTDGDDDIGFDSSGADFDPSLSISGDDVMGNFSVDPSLFDSFASVMIVLSNVGNDTTADDNNYYGYLLTAANGTYDFDNPFPGTPGGDHLSVYAAVPLPAALPMLLAALGGLGFISRRRKSQV